MKSHLLLALAVAGIALSNPGSAQTLTAELCAGPAAVRSEAPVVPEGQSPLVEMLGLAQGGVQYKDTGCTAFYDCAGGTRITCTGAANCSPTTTVCSNQGSTCPDAHVTVGAVICDGVRKATCPCPGVCFGCGTACQTNAQCGTSVCSCGGGKCVSGHCTCRF